MNKIYRVKFNKSLGEYQATSELSSNKKKTKNVGFISNIKEMTVYVFIFSLLSSNISTAFAGITVNGSNTNVSTSSTSGASVIDIAKPNDKGLSHNKYSDFNVSNPGVVFNNSNTDTVTSVVGNIQGNKNLEGQSAKIILNEINGINSSTLQGTMEVAGKKASIIIANQNGIIVDGVKTINADALTLTTGKFDANNVAFDVSKGNVIIKGNGLNTTGLSKFDIITKSAQISATIANKVGNDIVAGNTDVNIIAGENEVEYGSNKILKKNKATTKVDRAAIEIGGDALGSIYGNNITLVSTDSGAGVRQKGLISSPNDITISSEGSVSLNNSISKNIDVNAADSIIASNIKSTDSLTFKNGEGGIDLNNSVSKSIELASLTNLSMRNISSERISIDIEGDLAIGKSTNNDKYSVDTKDFSVNNSKSIYIEGSMNSDTLNLSTDDMRINNAIVNTGKASIDVKNNLIIDGQYSVIDFDGNQIENATAYVDNDQYGKIIAVDQSSKELDNVTVVSNSGLVSGDLKLNVGQKLVNSKGNISSENNSEINAKSVDNTGILLSKSDLNLNVKEGLNNNFLIQGNKTKVEANSIKNNATLTSIDGELTVKASEDLSNSGNIVADKFTFDGENTASLKNDNGRISAMLFDIKAKKIINDNNSLINAIQANQKYADDVNKIKTDSIFYDKNSFISMGTLDVDINTKEIVYGGHDDASSNLGLSAIDLSSSKSTHLSSDSDLTLSGVNLYLSKTHLEVKGDVNIKDKSNISYRDSFVGNANNFSMKDESTLGANYYRGVANASKIPSAITKNEDNGNFTLNLLGNFNNENSNLLVSKGVVNAEDINNSGQILGLDFLFNSKNFTNTQKIDAWRDTSITADRFLNSKDAAITAINKADIKTVDAINHGSIKSNYINIDSSQLINDKTGSIEGVENVFITSANVENNGRINSETINVDSHKLVNNSTGVIEGKKNVLIESMETENNGRILSDYVSVVGNILKNNKDAKIEGKNINIFLDDKKGIVDNSGDVLATGNIDITTHSYLNDKLIYAGKNVTVNIKNNDLTIDNKSQTAYGRENLNYNVDKKMQVNDNVINEGNINIKSKELHNKELVYSLKNVDIQTEKFINYINAYLGADKNIKIASDLVSNQEGATIYALNDLVVVSKIFENLIGKIKGGNSVNITTQTFLNDGRLSGEITAKESATTSHYKELPHSGGGTFSFRFNNLNYKVPDGSDLTTKRGLIESDKNITLNIGEKGTNKGVIAAIKGDLNINKIGDKPSVTFTNETLSKQYSITDLLKSSDPFSMRVYRKRVTVSGNKTLQYANLYEFFNDVFGNPNKKTKYGAYSYRNTDVIKMLQDDGFLNSISGDSDQVLRNSMSMIFGAEWKALDAGTLQDRWNAFVANQADPKYSMDIYSKDRTMLIAGNNYNSNGINFTNGKPDITKEMIKDGFNDEKTISVGKNDVSGLEGQLADLQNQEITNSIGGYDFEQFNKGELPNIDGLYDDNKLIIKTEVKDKYDYNEITFVPKDINTVNTPGYDKGILVNYLYQTKIPFNDNDYYGSNYYLKILGVEINSQNNNPIYSVGDSYFENNLIAEQYRILNQQAGYSLTSSEIAKTLMDNAKGEMDAQGLVVGQPLNQEQINNLQSDIVWYEWAATANDGYVLTPRVYVSNTSAQLDMALGNGASVTAGNDVNIKSENGSFINSNGTIMGNNVNIDVGNEGFVYTGSKASNGESISADSVNIKSGDVYIEGNGIVAENIDIEAGKDVNIKTGMQYVDGALINATDNVLSSTGEGNISIKGDNINLTGAGIETNGGDLSLEAKNDIVMKDVYEVDSSKQINTTSSAFSWGHDITDQSRAESSGSSLNTGNLTIKTGNDLKITGGSINAENSQVDVGGDFTAEAGKNLEYFHQETSFTGLFGSASGNMAYNNNKPGGYNKQASSSLTPNSYGVNAPGSGSVGFGFSHSSTKETINSLTHNNAQLNFGNGEVNVEKTFDFGGADINTSFKPGDDGDLSAAPTLTVNAGDIQTTKVEDKYEREYSDFSWSLGNKTTVQSSVAKLATDIANMSEQDKINRGTDDAGMKAGTVIADVANIVLGDVASVSNKTGFDLSRNSSSTTQYSENKNNISGNINFNSKKDITLNNVDISNSDNVSLDAKENVNINAGKDRFEESSDTFSVTVGKEYYAGVGPLGAAVSGSIGASGTKGSNHKEGTSYNNSNISSNNISIKSGNDLNIKGGVVGHDDSNVIVDSAGDINIESLQDTAKGSGQTTTVGAQVGVSVGTNGILPVAGVNVSVSKQKTDINDVNEQSGIKGNNVVIKGDKDLNLTGGFIEANNGSIDVAGDVNAKEIKDNVIDEDKTYTAGAGLGVGGKPSGGGGSISGGYGQGNNTYKKETNHATIDMGQGTVNIGGETNGNLNTDKDKKITVEKDVKTGAYQFEVSAPVFIPKKPKPEKKEPKVSEPPTRNDTAEPRPTPRPTVDDVPVQPQPKP
ncbi:hemagglutinin repeat-containing protein, partial [Providencia rettgeri]|nr:hemagglutinin repeat-containing protein [Providencia rettgeri]